MQFMIIYWFFIVNLYSQPYTYVENVKWNYIHWSKVMYDDNIQFLISIMHFKWDFRCALIIDVLSNFGHE